MPADRTVAAAAGAVTGEDLEVLARTLLGLCARDPWPVKVAVAHVVLNRAARGGWWGESVAAVCRAPWQFACWGEAGQRRRLLAATTETPALRECLAAASAAVAGLEPDRTGGACYLAPRGARGGTAERRLPSATIGDFGFFTCDSGVAGN